MKVTKNKWPNGCKKISSKLESGVISQEYLNKLQVVENINIYHGI